MFDVLSSSVRNDIDLMMRTTINIDDDVLNAVKELARRQAQPVGDVASKLLREALCGKHNELRETPARYGFQPFEKSTDIVTNELINQLREQAGD